jgi:glycosyltransferase involved in cell wall biosynthesis
LTNHSNNIHLKIGGDGPIDHWKSVARSLEIPPSSISFFGTLTKVQVANQMMQSNCFVLFSNFENLPLVMIEAMCCGLTVITTNVGGCREFLPLDQGHFLIEKKDEDALFNAFVQAIEQKNIQIEKKKTISEYASKTFSNEAIGEQFNTIYHSILKLDAK